MMREYISLRRSKSSMSASRFEGETRLTGWEEDIEVALFDKYGLARDHVSPYSGLDHRSIPSFYGIR